MVLLKSITLGNWKPYFAVVEENGRLVLLAHGVLWLAGNADFHTFYEQTYIDEGFRQRVIDFMSDIICQDMNDNDAGRYKKEVSDSLNRKIKPWEFNGSWDERVLYCTTWISLLFKKKLLSYEHLF